MAAAATSSPPLLQVRGLGMRFSSAHGLLGRHRRTVTAVEGVDLDVAEGDSVGLVGESGCGKTTLGRCILRAHRPTAGQLLYRRADGEVVDLAGLDAAGLRPYRHEVRMVFQDPYSSLNPRMTLLQIVGEPLRVAGAAAGGELEHRVAEMLRLVGLRPEYLHRYPHAFSGGERQRIGIARALITNPRLVVADEAVSALDVSVRGQILNLLQDLRERMQLTYLFVSHDLSVIEHLCDSVAVMYLGRIVERGPTREVFGAPRHPYTEALLSALPAPDPRLRRRGRRIVLQGDVPDPSRPPAGCVFHPRCPHAREDCETVEPGMEARGGRASRCHYAAELRLRGVAGGSSRSSAAEE